MERFLSSSLADSYLEIFKNTVFNTPRNRCCGYLLETPRRGDSYKSPQHMFLGVNKEKKPFIINHTGTFWDSLQRQIRFNGKILGDKCCRYNESPLYLFILFIFFFGTSCEQVRVMNSFENPTLYKKM